MWALAAGRSSGRRASSRAGDTAGEAGAASHPGGQGTEARAAELGQQARARARAQGVLLAAAWTVAAQGSVAECSAFSSVVFSLTGFFLGPK